MALGNSAGILFKISADNSDAKRAFNETEAGVKGLGGAMGAMGGPAGIASAAIAAVGAAALAAVVGIARLTVAASELGSQLFDAQAQTGLTASQLSALKLAADTSGSSLDSISNSVAKFNVLVGQAADGNEKASGILAKYGITATDSGEALEQAFEAVYNATNKNTAAAELFKDKTGQTIPVIDAMSGSLKDAEAAAKKLGLTLTEEDIKAADEFGDTLDILGKQAASAGQKFALELMPNVTHAMQTISGEMENNQDVARTWGREAGNTVRGVEVYFQGLNAGVQAAMAGINRAFGTNLQATINWANTVLAVVSPLFAIFQMIGAANPLDLKGSIGGKVGAGVVPSGGGGGGGGGGKGGGGTATDPDKQRQEELRKTQADYARRLDVYKAHLSETEAALELSLSQKLIDEKNFEKVTGELKLKALLFEKQLNDDLLKSGLLNDEEQKEYKTKQIVLDKNLGEQRKKIAKEVFNVISKETAKELAEFEKAEKKKQAISDERQQRFNKQLRERQDRLRALRAEEEGRSLQGVFSGVFGAIGGSKDVFDNAGNLIGKGLGTIGDAFLKLKEIGIGAMGALAEGVGSLVQNWVLMGSTGPDAMKKLTASILAGVAAQAAVLAIFELAKGFAALFFNPAEAAAHFKAAALFGTVAVAAGVSGRAIAGDSFNGAAGQATGSGGNGQGQSQQNNFTTRFNGFGSQQSEAINQNRIVMGALVDELSMFRQKVQGMSPGEVVAIAADENPGAFRTGYESTLSDDARATDGLMRRIGAAR